MGERIKYFVLYRRSYGDFDVAHDVPVAVSGDRPVLLLAAERHNDKLTPDEQASEVTFYVSSQKDVVLL